MQLIKINEWLTTEIFSLLFAFGIDSFKGVCGKIRKWRLKKRLEKLIFEEILSRYGNEVYYNDLDHFLSVNRVIYNVVSNAGQSNPYQYKSKSVMVNYCLQKFSEEYPQHLRYYGEIRELLRKYMEVVFQALNEFSNEEAQVLGKLMKELTGELSCQLDEVQEGISGINRKLDLLVEQRTPEKTEFFSESYWGYVSRLYEGEMGSGHIERKLYAKNDETPANILDVLLRERKVLLLGEAGFGKTHEALELLGWIRRDERTRGWIAFYLPLHEYGVLYQK